MTPILFTASVKNDEARAFYSQVMRFTLTDDNPFSFEFDAAGVKLRIQKVEDFAPQPFTATGWRVADVATERDRLAAQGARILDFPGLEQDEHGTWTTPDGAQVCRFKESDGNILSRTRFSR